jgi:hypothetical protein
MQHDDNRQMRKLKKEIKRLGNKRLRRQLKQSLEDCPEEAQFSEVNFGNLSSETLNGLDRPLRD